MIDKRLFKLPGLTLTLIWVTILTGIQGIAIICQAHFLTRALVNSWQMKPLATLTTAIILFGGAFLLRHVCVWLKNIILDHYADHTSNLLRDRLLDQVYVTGANQIAQTGTGKLVTVALDGINNVYNYFNLIFAKIFDMMIIPFLVIIYIYWQSVRSGIILTIVFPVVILFMIILGFAAQDKADRQYAGFIKLSNHFVDSLRGLATLKFLGLSKRYETNVYEVSEDYRRSTMDTLRIAILSTFALDWFTTLSIALLALFLGLALINGSMPLFPALVSLILAPEFFLPIRDFGNDYHATLDGKNALGDILDILDQPTIQNRELVSDSFHWDANSTLTANHFNLQYNPDNAYQIDLKDISFTLHGYQKVAIIGMSGSGKSTLLNTLGGFLTPMLKTQSQTDNFTLNGQALPHLSQANWQKQFSFIPQFPYLFADTIAANIKFYRPEATEAEVQAAVVKAGLADFVASLKDGLATKVGEGGRGISGGQAQRIALARAFLDQDRRILMFDEPTAHLDIETEYALKETMKPLFKDHLVLFATHRLHWLKEMDYVIVMKDGQIVQQGPVAELAQQPNGEFKALTEHMRKRVTL
ncbi:thiol reductant ABC exporter subunit CydD [Lactobacillus sp. CC-MHH1034]|uniref:thiol reductant ABC exporter subunit CydD n=1 Tax=Agrilactobacillus fermenti TaxID=2586909 RepID=UPI001E5FC47A|nr:thiol reductant ABC exporter subunit CydD [Agrilactobacillus fermenti]MCD2255523.1 thiol reductant ABC exporter subunit CydD [Agrilactobacillus fermenti]